MNNLKGQGWYLHCLPFCDSISQRVDLSSKKKGQQKKGAVKLVVNAYWSFKKISCSTCLFFYYCFLVYNNFEKLIQFFWLPSCGSNSRKGYTLRLLAMYLEEGEGGVWEVVLPGSGKWLILGKKRLNRI